MLNTNLPPMRPALGVCPNADCGASGRIGVHSLTDRRYKCHGCGKTFAETVGTPLYGLKYPTWIVVLILTLLAAGCPRPAMVFAFGIDERTVMAWQLKAGGTPRRSRNRKSARARWMSVKSKATNCTSRPNTARCG